MKAVELALKSALTLYGAAGWLDSALLSHDVFGEASRSPDVTKTFLDALENYDPFLPDDIRRLERLVPNKTNIKKLTYDDAANTEYPFFAFVSGTTPSLSLKLYSPATEFKLDDSRKHFQTAFRLLIALSSLSPEMKSWKVRFCRPL